MSHYICKKVVEAVVDYLTAKNLETVSRYNREIYTCVVHAFKEEHSKYEILVLGKRGFRKLFTISTTGDYDAVITVFRTVLFAGNITNEIGARPSEALIKLCIDALDKRYNKEK